MNKALILGALAASVAGMVPAQAATLIFTPGGGGLTVGQTDYANFQTSFGSSVQSGGGGVVSPPNVDGQYAQPATGDQGDPFYYVFAGGSVLFDFGAVSQFGFDLGSADDYNSLEVFFSTGPSQVFSGEQLNFVPPADGNQTGNLTNGRVTIFAASGEVITGARFGSGQPSFEFDNIGIAAVPEPTTWALFILGFGMIGAALRRRSRAVRDIKAKLNFA